MEYATALVEENRRLAEVLRVVDSDITVPTGPAGGWGSCSPTWEGVTAGRRGGVARALRGRSRELEHGHGKGVAAVRGCASALLLAVLRRIAADDQRLQVLGDAAAWRTWLARTPL